MNIDPVQANSAGIERQTPEKRVRVSQPPRSTDSGTSPNAEFARKENSPPPSVIPEHEVKLLLDTSSDRVIYQVLDKQSRALVLQVPSAEEIRNIQRTQELLQRIASGREGSD
jgi:hypothetical protein